MTTANNILKVVALRSPTAVPSANVASTVSQ
jgi:hypothetical protein